MKGRDVKMVKIVKPEMKAALDAALDAAIAVMDSDPSIKQGRDERLVQAKRMFPEASEADIRKIQDIAAVHTLVGAIVERASEHSEMLLMVVLEAINRITLQAMVETMAPPEPEEKPKAEPKIAAASDIPNTIPHNLRNMKES